MVKIQLALKGALPGYHISDSANTRRRALRVLLAAAKLIGEESDAVQLLGCVKPSEIPKQDVKAVVLDALILALQGEL